MVASWVDVTSARAVAKFKHGRTADTASSSSMIMCSVLDVEVNEGDTTLLEAFKACENAVPGT